MIRLSPAMTWNRQGRDVFVYGERQVLKLPNCAPEVDEMMRTLDAGCDTAAIAALAVPGATGILDALRSADCLVGHDSRQWAGTMLERHADYICAMGANPHDAQAVLRRSRIAILGVGGIGSVALMHLVSSGVERFTLIDGDVVQQHNLNRQFIYAPADVGRNKVDAAADWVLSRNSSAAVNVVPMMLTDSTELESVLAENVSLLILAADSPFEIGAHAAHACRATRTALVGADCGLRTASWGPLLEPDEIAAWLAEVECARAGSPVPPATQPMTASSGPTNAIAASYLAKDVVHWLVGLPVNCRRRKVVIDTDALTTEG